MSLFDWLTLIAAVVCLSLGILIFSFNRKAFLNKLFLIGSFFGFFYAFTEVMMWQSSSLADAILWSKIGSIWPFFVVLVFHFVLVFTNSKLLKNKFIYLTLYAPAFLFWIISASTYLINSVPVMEYWGYEDFRANTIISYLSVLWASTLPVLAFVLCFKYYHSTVDEKRKHQAKFVTIGLGIPIYTYLLTNMAFPLVGLKTPNLGHFAILFFSIFVGYSIFKYELFTLDAALAAENIVSIMPDSLILADMNGKIIRVNKRLLNFLGYSENELIGKTIPNLCPKEVAYENVLKELSEHKAINDFELNFSTKLGEEKKVSFSGSVVRSKTGQDVGVTCIIHDITERKKAEEHRKVLERKVKNYSEHLKYIVDLRTAQLKDANERLVKSERFAAIGELAGMVGHDLRNPLAGIKNATYYLKKKSGTISEFQYKEMIEIIEKAIDHSDKIINDLLEYSREMHLELTKYSAHTLVDETLKTIKVPSRLKIVNNVQKEDLIWVNADKMLRVFENLVKNAIDAMPEKGTLEISSCQRNDGVEIDFADTGTGIPEETLQKIFTPLFTTKAQGMGFGLAICKRIMEAHGGTIEVKTKVNKGTTFVIHLPTQRIIDNLP